MTSKKFNLHDTIGHMVNTTARQINNSIARAFSKAGHDITVEQWEVLMALWNRDGQCQHELATFCLKDRPSITRILDNMEKRELVVRVSSQVDRRNKGVHLTEKGKSLQDPLNNIAKAATKVALKNIDKDVIESTKAFLKMVQANLH